MRILKILILYFLKLIGLFKISQLVSRKSSTVLCYHGISNQDENKFLPANYISFKDFKVQLEKLLKAGYRFITLDELNKKIKTNELDNKELVLTIDDGLKSIFDEMIPYLEENKIKSTLYVTTQDSINKDSIFRLLCNYIFWKSNHTILTTQDSTINIKDVEKRWDYIVKIEKELNFEQREVLIDEIAQKLEVKIDSELKKSFQIINYEDLNKLDLTYVDIQLHTHSHDMHMEESLLEKDIIKNRDLLEELSKSPLIHFCYPSGVYKNSHLSLLSKLDIQTATTCEQGFVTKNTNPLLIPRLIINSNMPNIVFEAELNGLMNYLRRVIKIA